MSAYRRFNTSLEVRQPARSEIFSTSSRPPSIPVKAFFDRDDITIYNHDILVSSPIRPGSVDLIVTSPPYNLDISYGNHNDKLPYKEYRQFTRKWLEQCRRLAKPDGRLCVNIPLDKNKGGQQSVYADITTIAKKAKWRYHCTIVWNEQNISRRTAWGSWKSASAPFIIAPVEMIVVFYKKTWRKTLGAHLNDLRGDEFLEWTNGVWTFPGEKKTRVNHPAPYPVELPRRCIKLFSFVGDTVFDPFLGSGTTLIACLETKRKGIGNDIDKRYCQLAKNRIVKSMSQPLHRISKRSARLNGKSIHEFFANHKTVEGPSNIKNVAVLLAKLCELPHPVTRSGKKVHLPSIEQVTMWIQKKLKRNVRPSRRRDLPTNEQIAEVLSKILKVDPEKMHSEQTPPISSEQIRSWVARHT